jgi:hypothetical protein
LVAALQVRLTSDPVAITIEAVGIVALDANCDANIRTIQIINDRQARLVVGMTLPCRNASRGFALNERWGGR